ncbi:MAG TPA: sigma-70 family RNA polymerase sigma factor [Vicinamibacterales bacterium]|jgi:RNA polymerase sigma-70 factor
MVASSALDASLLARLHAKARADRWALSSTAFAVALDASVQRAFDSSPDRRQLEKYLDSLHLEDLALAWACAQGSDAAWEHVMREHRPALYRAADAIDPSSGREIADSLWAELFGLTERDGERRSHFRYFHGRSTLATWLRAVLAQRHVDRIRSHRRLDVLPDDESAAALPAPAVTMNPARDRYLAVMRRAVLAAVAVLAPRDRLRLTCYYAQDLTLAQIGRALGEHEATVSRHLTRTRRAIRSSVEHELADRERMNEAEITECFASVLDDAGSLDIADLLGSGGSRKEVGQHRSTDKETSGAAGG